jgi:hypothetical protein
LALSFAPLEHSKAQSAFLNKISVSFSVPEFIGTAEHVLDIVLTRERKQPTRSQAERFVSNTIVPLLQLRAGVSFLYEQIEFTDTQNQTITEPYKATYPTMLLNGTYAYLEKPNLELYARLGVGLFF